MQLFSKARIAFPRHSDNSAEYFGKVETFSQVGYFGTKLGSISLEMLMYIASQRKVPCMVNEMVDVSDTVWKQIYSIANNRQTDGRSRQKLLKIRHLLRIEITIKKQLFEKDRSRVLSIAV